MKRKTLILISSLFCSTAFLAGCGHTHTLGSFVTKVEATCETSGREAYYYCESCQKYYDESKQETTLEKLTIPALGHNWVKVNSHASTCFTDGWKEYYRCSRCGKYAENAQGENIFTDLAGWKEGFGKVEAEHHMVLVEGLAKTCSTDGYKDAYMCESCGYYYEDADGEVLIGNEMAYNLWTKFDGKVLASHNIVKVEATAPTGFEMGNVEYYRCADCGEFFGDEEATIPIEKDSWLVDPLGTVTYNTVEQFDSYTSKEGDYIAFEKYGVGTESGYMTTIEAAGFNEGQLYNGYLMFGDLKGIKKVSIKGTGDVHIQTGMVAWSWKTSTHIPLAGDDTATVLTLDPERDNAIIIASNGGRVLVKEVAFESALTPATGSTDTDLLQDATIVNGYTSAPSGYGYFTNERTNNSESALVLGAKSTKAEDEWPFVWVELKEAINLDDYNIVFDAMGVVGRMRISITPMDANGAAVGGEVGWDLSTRWNTYTYAGGTGKGVAKFLRFTVFVTPSANIHENIVDNLRLSEVGLLIETNSGAYSYRAFDPGHNLPETAYAGKAVAFDFKPLTENASFEIDFMSDNDTYVGKKNYINVIGGQVTSTFGQITQKADGWVTLTVSGLNIAANTRIKNGDINGIYIATVGPMSGSVMFNYRSIRAVDDIAPNRRPVVYNGPGAGAAIWGGNLSDTMTMGDFKSNSGNEILLSLKASGNVGSTITINVANDNSGGHVQHIFVSVVITVGENGALTTNHGRLVKAIDGDWYNLILKASDMNQTELNAVDNNAFFIVFWIGEMTAATITMDHDSLHIYAPGVLA